MGRTACTEPQCLYKGDLYLLGQFSVPVQTGPPSLLYNGYRVFPGGKERPGCDVDHQPPSSAEVKKRVELYLYSPSGPSWTVLG